MELQHCGPTGLPQHMFFYTAEWHVERGMHSAFYNRLFERYGARSTSDIKACTRTFLRRHNARDSSRYVVSSMSGNKSTLR